MALASVLLAAPAQAETLDAPASIASWLDAAPPLAVESLRPVLQGPESTRAEDYFRVPYPGRRYLHPPDIPQDLFSETFRIGVDSGILFPLIARQADYHIGWWARLSGQLDADVGLDLFRSAVEISLGVGQSQSSRAEQPFRITSSYTFLTVRGVADFLPWAPADLFVFAGLGGGLEFASGHVIRVSGTVEETRKTNFNLLMETGGGYGFELAPGFYIEGRVTFTYPVGSPNITLFVLGELGVQFLFQ